MLRYVEQIGWRYVNPPEALRLRGEQSVYVPEENRERNVQLIDFDHSDNNN